MLAALHFVTALGVYAAGRRPTTCSPAADGGRGHRADRQNNAERFVPRHCLVRQPCGGRRAVARIRRPRDGVYCCAISNLSVSYLTPTNATMRAAVAAANIILVSAEASRERRGDVLRDARSLAAARPRRARQAVGRRPLWREADRRAVAWFASPGRTLRERSAWTRARTRSSRPARRSTRRSRLDGAGKAQWGQPYIRSTGAGRPAGALLPALRHRREQRRQLRATMFTNSSLLAAPRLHRRVRPRDRQLGGARRRGYFYGDFRGYNGLHASCRAPMWVPNMFTGSTFPAKDGTFTANFLRLDDGCRLAGAWSVSIDGATGALLLIGRSCRRAGGLSGGVRASSSRLPVHCGRRDAARRARLQPRRSARAPTASITECLY